MRSSIAILAALCACTSATTSGAPERSQTIRGAGVGNLTVVPVTDASTHTFSSPIDEVWLVLPSVYDSLAIPKALIDNKTHTISNQGQKIRQRLGRTPLSRFIECGSTQIGPNADSYEVFLTVTSRVSAAGTGSTVSTTVEALARPLTFNQDYSRCSSRGLLETRIADALKARLPK
jgi:hypothetical protein